MKKYRTSILCFLSAISIGSGVILNYTVHTWMPYSALTGYTLGFLFSICAFFSALSQREKRNTIN
ncbi:hypothetical protein J2Z48_002782 [Croceifilum oryzae]|uniref:Uncharacterized protein n=1 Tax=Croceifilum oryzae TaxID=1553429 RepID=A0AAJ1TLX0_9BACL|nr:hypothetical protein [Croceifilum oryzae]